MAESSAATQSPSVSSSSSGAEPSALGGGGGSPGACPALGAKSCGSSCAAGLSSLCSDEPPSKSMTSSFLSSSEIHNPDPTTPLGEKSETLGSQFVLAKGKDPLVLLDKKKLDSPQGTNKDRVDAPVSLATGIPCSHPSIPDSFPEQPAFLSKEIGPAEEWVVKDQEPKNPNKVPDGEDRSALDFGQSKAEHICTYSLSPSELPVASVEKDSPESPFEVIIDKATFDREFKDLYKENPNDLGGWAAHGDRESPADLLEMNDKLFPLRNKEAGRYPSSVLLGRQFSHTTAALEEVSRCVNDMHNFTNEILTWDLDPQAKQQANKTSCTTESTGLDRSELRSEIPVINLKTNPQQKMPVCSFNGSTPITKSTGDWTEAFTEGKPVRDYLSSTKEAGGNGVPGSSQLHSELPGSMPEKWVSGSGAATVEVTLPNLRGAWPNSVMGEVTEVDSSGESDDTVIEDITEKPDSLPSAAAKTSEREIKETPSRETVRSEMCENSEQPQAQPETPTQKSLEGEVASQVPNTLNEVTPEKLDMTNNPKVCSAAPPSVLNETGFSLTVPASAKLESLLGKYVEDTDGSSPEDLMAVLTGAEEKGIVDKEEGDVLEAVLEKIADFKNTLPVELLHESELSGSETKNIKSKYSEDSRETTGGAPTMSPDLEQEQLTIRAIKELGERQAEKVQDEGISSGGKLKQTFAPQSGPQSSSDILEHTDVKTGSDLGIPKNPTIIKNTRIDSISSLTKTEMVNKNVLARLLSDFPVHDLIFWRDVKKTGFVFGTTLIMLLSLAAFSVISVVSYLILALLSVTISFRVYKSVIQAVQKSEEGHPFKAYLDVDITLSSEAFHNYMNAAMVHVNKALKLIIRLFLVEDLVDSLKLAVFMWLMTYVGAVFNGITLLILAELLVFSVPIVYEKYKTQIDHYVGIARDQTKSIVEKIQAKLPGIAKKKAE
ncbi:reticulon-3 isoform 2 [Mus musculus]|uniref:Isoform 2 of Reticulon-3 n=1 Tax=Mus musculus TaxID=10090 RepID=Q9ES97-2|nr:reticulon-3 isoform 2 [Mus musculus]AAR08193.1 RTN3-A [Mus musculus]|eukprot:NP_001003933.1 reticulon-3 isoform 2 [Mus musculus]